MNFAYPAHSFDVVVSVLRQPTSNTVREYCSSAAGARVASLSFPELFPEVYSFGVLAVQLQTSGMQVQLVLGELGECFCRLATCRRRGLLSVG